MHLIGLLSILFRCNGFTSIQKAVIRPAADHLTVTMTFFWCSLTLGSILELLLSPTTELFITSCIKPTSHCALQSNWEMICCCCVKRWHFKMTIFKNLFVSSWGTHLLSFFTFPIFFKCQVTLEWLRLSSLATSHVAVRGSALMMALSWSLSLLMASHHTPHFQGSCLLCKTSWTTTVLYVCQQSQGQMYC